MRKYVILFALLTIVLAACRVEVNTSLDIEEDGSALVGAEVGFDEEFRELIGDQGGDPLELFGELPDLAGEDVIQTERTEGDMEYFGVATEIDDLSTFDPSQSDMETFSSFSYTFDDNSARLEATVASQDLGDVAGGDELPIDPSTITDEFLSINVIVTMPGSVTEHNADEVRSDGSLVWNIPFSGSTEIVAASDFGTSTGSWVLFILVIVLAVGIIAAVVAIIVSRRESQKAVEAAAAAHAADTTPPPPVTEDHGAEDDGPEDDATGSDAEAEVSDEEADGSDAGDDQPEST